jgi:predicted AAA+ superfamily ATPase
LAREIADHFLKNGFGKFGKARAFRWNAAQGRLEGVAAQDPIRLEDLVGYDEQRRPLLANIEGFVSGRPGNNVLIYGERGTGKSSTVKALLNAHQDRGLRLIEVSPTDLTDYPHILQEVRGRRERFILFLDDLAFEENETGYKGLKAVLEGSVEANPGNVLLIATSNRRHLVREFFSEREEGERQTGRSMGRTRSSKSSLWRTDSDWSFPFIHPTRTPTFAWWRIGSRRKVSVFPPRSCGPGHSFGPDRTTAPRVAPPGSS